jgi:hypothetical protein
MTPEEKARFEIHQIDNLVDRWLSILFQLSLIGNEGLMGFQTQEFVDRWHSNDGF